MTTRNTHPSLGLTLLKQFKEEWGMLKQGINKIPDDKWSEVKNDWSFSWTVHHIIEAADFYSRSTDEEMKWGTIANIDWDNDSKEIIEKKKSKVTKEALLSYSEEVDKRLSAILKKSTDEELLKKDDFDWFESIFEKLVYLLRHNAHHIGELARTLREWDCERIKWRVD